MSLFDAEVVVWFTGDDSTSTLTALERDSLAEFLDHGGRLFLTGQSIAQDIDGTAFLTEYLHADYVGNTDDHTLLGVEGDTVSGSWGLVFTLGAAGNQTSQDEIEADSVSVPILVYDLDMEHVAGVRVENVSTGSKVVFFGVGLEGVNSPNPSYATRAEIMGSILRWFGIPVAVRETALRPPGNLSMWLYPNPAERLVHLELVLPPSELEDVDLAMYDAAGRRIRTLLRGALVGHERSIQWDGRDELGRVVPTGVYFACLRTGARKLVRRLCLIR
jgi:hypothetical protein